MAVPKKKRSLLKRKQRNQIQLNKFNRSHIQDHVFVQWNEDRFYYACMRNDRLRIYEDQAIFVEYTWDFEAMWWAWLDWKIYTQEYLRAQYIAEVSSYDHLWLNERTYKYYYESE